MKSVVLFSGGLDSTYNLYQASQQTQIVLALTFDYGQRAAEREIAHAKAQAAHLGVRHQVLELKWFTQFTRTSLVNSAAVVPQGGAVQIDERVTSEDTARAVWVPNRNGILLNIAAGFAEGLEADVVIPGFNAEEAVTFADNSSDFLHALDQSWSYSTRAQVRTLCYSTQLSKTEIVAEGKKLDLRLDLVWPCYLGGTQPCGECESCQRFARALRVNGVDFQLLQKMERPR